MAVTLINPKDLAPPRGFSHGAVGSGRILYIAGQVGSDREGKLVSEDLVEQFDQALANLLRVVREAEGKPEDVVKINLYVLDCKEYRERAKDLGVAYRKHMGRHFPAMTLAEVKGLFNGGAKVEIEGIALLP